MSKNLVETAEALGLSRDEILNRVVDKIAGDFLCIEPSDDEDYDQVATEFSSALERRLTERIDAAVDKIAGEHVEGDVIRLIEDYKLQKTNEWGEARSEPVTFREYLVARAESFLTEKVNHRGKSRNEADGFSWSPDQTRVAHLIDRHLQYHIEAAMKGALKTANSQIMKGVEETVRMKLKEVSDKLKVEVKG